MLIGQSVKDIKGNYSVDCSRILKKPVLLMGCFLLFISLIIMAQSGTAATIASVTSVTNQDASLIDIPVVKNRSDVWYYVASSEKIIFGEFYQQLSKQLDNIDIVPLNPDEIAKCDYPDKNAHFITAGILALKAISNCQISQPIFSFYITQNQYNKIFSTRNTNLKKINVFFVDQPLIIQLALAKQFLPRRYNVGILYSPSSSDQIKQLEKDLPEDYNLITILLDDTKKLVKNLVSLLKETDYIIVPLDNTLFNSRTAKIVLLTSYRHQKPMFGNSKGFVRAGFIASSYSTPEIIIQQVIDTIKSTPAIYSQRFYPNDFEIIQNVEVAHSLDLSKYTNKALKTLVQETLQEWGEKK